MKIDLRSLMGYLPPLGKQGQRDCRKGCPQHHACLTLESGISKFRRLWGPEPRKRLEVSHVEISDKKAYMTHCGTWCPVLGVPSMGWEAVGEEWVGAAVDCQAGEEGQGSFAGPLSSSALPSLVCRQRSSSRRSQAAARGGAKSSQRRVPTAPWQRRRRRSGHGLGLR